MPRPRLIVVGLDGYEPGIADRMMQSGELPHLRRLRERSAWFHLDHGEAKRTGLAWEHVSLGRDPESYERWAAVRFDPDTYQVHKEDTAGTPFIAALDRRAVIFDAPYFDLSATANCRGVVRWGAHDPGVAAQSLPATLSGEIAARFGRYPAEPYIYGFVWPDPARARKMADALVQAVDLRTEICLWLFGERLPDWDLAMVVISEYHSAIEALWHGIDPAHPLHGLPSAAPARDGVIGVYQAGDRLLGAMGDRFPDASVVSFSMHGMSANDTDLTTMLLLPELLYRRQFRRPYFVPRRDWMNAADGIPLLAPDEMWSRAVNARLGVRSGAWTAAVLQRLGLRPRPTPPSLPGPASELGWMPAVRYRAFWPQMDAFALPSFYDGRIRINLAGRERSGRVALRDYDATCDELTELVQACRNARTGEPIAAAIERPVRNDPLAAPGTQADLVVIWRGNTVALTHPGLGLVGPAPYRRTGGHSGGHGVAYVAAPGVAPGYGGVRSAFDVTPTLIDLLGAARPNTVSGRPLLAFAVPPDAA